MRHYSEFGFADPENAKHYAEGSPANFVPGFSIMHGLVVQLLSETAGVDGHTLVLGAGGGLELKAFADARPDWRFTAVEPSPEMIAAAKNNLDHVADRIDWIEGYIADTPAGPFDAATCLLTLHLIPDNGAKLDALCAIRERLKPGGAFAIVDNCLDPKDPNAKRTMDRYIAFARSNGIDEDLLEHVATTVTEKGECITAEREVALLAEAGFTDVDLFFAGLSWRGWIARRPL
ncbi:MAG: class I SAM-dependent methyltransferase [Pseudomonadota bacterium]